MSNQGTRRAWEVLLVLFGTALAVFISASLPQSSIQRDSAAAVVGLAVALIAVILYESRRERPKVTVAPDPKVDADLRRRSRQLGQQIAAFAASRRVNDPMLIPPSHGLPDDAMEEQQNGAFDRHTEALLRFAAETRSQYDAQFMGFALALYDDLATRGWITVDRGRFEHPTNQLGVEAIARTLQAIGEASDG